MTGHELIKRLSHLPDRVLDNEVQVYAVSGDLIEAKVSDVGFLEVDISPERVYISGPEISLDKLDRKTKS